jgi:hypothetical protein
MGHQGFMGSPGNSVEKGGMDGMSRGLVVQAILWRYAFYGDTIGEAGAGGGGGVDLSGRLFAKHGGKKDMWQPCALSWEYAGWPGFVVN